MNKPQNPPKHLSSDAKRLWRQVVAGYVLEPHHERVLQATLEALDRCNQAREVLADEGITISDRFGVARQHPAVAIERDARLAFFRGIRELALDSGAVDDVRPPRLGIA